MIMKKHCVGCPYDIGQPATEMAYNLACLPSIGEIHQKTGFDKAWACHSAKKCVCKGFAEDYPERVDQPLYTEKGIHF